MNGYTLKGSCKHSFSQYFYSLKKNISICSFCRDDTSVVSFVVTYFFLFLNLSIINLHGLPRWRVVKNLPANAGDARDTGLIPGSGRPPGRGHENPYHRSCLENHMDRGAWRAVVLGVAESRTRLSHSTLIHTNLMYDTVLASGIQLKVIQIHTHTHIHAHTHRHTHICKIFFRFFTIIGYYKVLNGVPCAVC